MINKFYEGYKYMRFIALAIFSALSVFGVCKCHAYTLEVDYFGPGSEYDQDRQIHDNQMRDQETREALENIARGEGTDHDFDTLREAFESGRFQIVIINRC